MGESVDRNVAGITAKGRIPTSRTVAEARLGRAGTADREP